MTSEVPNRGRPATGTRVARAVTRGARGVRAISPARVVAVGRPGRAVPATDPVVLGEAARRLVMAARPAAPTDGAATNALTAPVVQGPAVRIGRAATAAVRVVAAVRSDPVVLARAATARARRVADTAGFRTAAVGPTAPPVGVARIARVPGMRRPPCPRTSSHRTWTARRAPGCGRCARTTPTSSPGTW